MKRIIYFLLLILAMNNCTQESNTIGRKNLTADSLIVLAKKRVYHEDGSRTYTDWMQFPTRTIYHLAGYNSHRKSIKKNKYGQI